MQRDRRSEIYFGGKRVLILIAHPDDESMFFSPLLMAMKQDRHVAARSVHLLCLSAGHYRSAPIPNLGTIRTREIQRAAALLGVDDCVVERLTDGALEPDWNLDSVVPIVHDYIQRWNIDTIVTFDDAGVSGHANHISAHFSALALGQSRMVDVFCLRSYSILTKYTAWLSYIIRRYIQSNGNLLLVPHPAPSTVWQLMEAHKSQFVWFRRLFVIFSSYSYFNEYQRYSFESQS